MPIFYIYICINVYSLSGKYQKIQVTGVTVETFDIKVLIDTIQSDQLLKSVTNTVIIDNLKT